MNSLKPIYNNNEWSRNENTGVIYNTNKAQLDAYRDKHKVMKHLSEQQEQINRLENDLLELKKMLCTII